MDFQGFLVNLLDGLAVAGLLFLLAVGLTVIFGLVDVLNLAHGALYMGAGYVWVVGDGTPSMLALIGALLVAIAAGSLMGVGLHFSLKPIANKGHLDQALLTLGLAMIISELVLHAQGRGFNTLAIPDALNGSVEIAGSQFPTYRLVVIGASIVLGGLAYYVFERTKLGSLTRAAIDDPQMLAVSGYDVEKIKIGVLVAGAALAAIAGVLGAPLLNLRPGLDNEVLTLALIVIVVGGLGSIKGAALGAVIIGLLQNLGAAYVPAVAPYLLFGLMVLVLLVRPRGLFGRAA
ncbi:MAG: branched-chain amino acid ABC transporter permease [Nocardioides sp.]|nr:branched-chain amino acid ABC transporter permease [Nocardioides sp.]